MSCVIASRLLGRLRQAANAKGSSPDWSNRESSIPGATSATASTRPERDAVQAALAQLPDGDRIRTFDAYRARLLALPAAIAVASPARQEELCRIVVEQVVVNDRVVEDIVWTPPARPFFERQRECPQGGLGTHPPTDSRGLSY